MRNIVLDRRNRLAAAVSIWTALKTGVWQAQRQSEIEGPVPHFEFSDEDLLAHIRRVDGDLARCARGSTTSGG